MDWVIAVQIVGVAGLLDTMPPVLRHSICGAAYLLVVVVSLASLQLLLPSSIIILAWHTKAIFNGTLTNVLVSAFNAHYLFFIEIVKRVKSFLRFHCLDFVVTQCCECIARLLPFYRAFFMDKMTGGGGKFMRRGNLFFRNRYHSQFPEGHFQISKKFQQDYHFTQKCILSKFGACLRTILIVPPLSYIYLKLFYCRPNNVTSPARLKTVDNMDEFKLKSKSIGFQFTDGRVT